MNLLLDTKKYLVQLSIVFAVLSFGLFAMFTDPNKVYAQDSNFADGITVDSKLDTTDSNVGDNICDDGSGNCTLRAAIQESNATTGTQTITFNISGTADFVNGGQNGYTIQPTSGLPNITDTVNIDGYTQPGSQANTTIAPNPLNGRLLIELDGSGAGNVNGLSLRADSIVIRGLVINNFGEDAVDVDYDNSVIAGNYMGTEPDGTTAAPNDNLAIGTGIGTTDGLRIGGLVPADRNLVSGNGTVSQGGGISPNTGHNNWTIQGNYIGVDKTGLVALGNAQPGGSGSLSLDNSDGHIVGGSQPGAINVISGNLGHGIAPHNVDNGQIIGNYIGVGYDGVTPLGNGYSGITLSDCVNMLIEDNIIANSGNAGIGLYEDTVGTQIYGNTIYNNERGGVMVFGATNTQIGTAGQGNSIHDNITYNIVIHAINLMGSLLTPQGFKGI
jgi:parallel beta-helix repeat protein